ncbi:MAG: tRNA (N6-isopentenyl adenosine(37)-C2)-methylthiotransferase MiaB [Armatimonadota bacterium]|nr:tRNA (N6-isopentenyl adenosine(37)-C2)-methylthiotransferase MiaB [Armatimonadota bacterium]MDR5696540.1 tRNA (N6-isopentenyl adenosine(37)-C2)-methylthiotransferase MiaB [Armatimonadota bacterium]
MPERYHIITYGCQMNVRDSEAMAGMLEAAGYERAEGVEDADVILLNTCTVREGADDRAYGRVGELRRLKQRKPTLILGMAGCLVQKDREEVLRRAPHLDLVFGVHNLHRLPELLRQARDGCQRVYEVWDCRPKDEPLPVLPAVRSGGVRAYVNIIHGCNKFCTFCIVPFVRGRERSVPPEEVVAEVQQLAVQGYREVTLLGQNVDSYGQDLRPRTDLAELLARVHQVEGIERIRFTTSHPRDMTERLVRAVADLPKVCEHIHLPVQSGDDEVLRRMHRAYTVTDYLRIVETIRSHIPQASITTDIIVGFPGETEEQFENTLRLVETVQFDACNTAVYSPREGTKAAVYDDPVDAQTKRRWLWSLNRMAERIALARNRRLVGSTQEVLVEERGRDGGVVGRTRTNKVVTLPGPEAWIGRTIRVRISEAGSWVLRGEPVGVVAASA